MSLSDNVRQQLQGLQGNRLPTSVRTSDAAGVQIRLDVTSIDSMSCEFMELELFVPSLRDADFALVKKWALKLSERITYLLEDIGPLEFDEDRGEALMRSTPPNRSDAGASFFEVILSTAGNGSFSLKRFESRSGAGRSQVPIVLTREVLLKLVDDLLATAP